MGIRWLGEGNIRWLTESGDDAKRKNFAPAYATARAGKSRNPFNTEKGYVGELNRNAQDSLDNKQWTPEVAFNEAKNVNEKEDAVAWALNELLGGKAGDYLQRTVGYGTLLAFINNMRWSNMTKDNTFIQLLYKIWVDTNSPVHKRLFKGAEIKPSKTNNNNQYYTEPVSEQLILEDDSSLTRSQRDNQQRQQTNFDKKYKKKFSNKDDDTNINYLDPKKYINIQHTVDLTKITAKNLFMCLYNGYALKKYNSQLVNKITSDKSNDVYVINPNAVDNAGEYTVYYIIDPVLNEILERSSIEDGKDIIPKEYDEYAQARDRKDTADRRNNEYNKGREQNRRDVLHTWAQALRK